MATSVRSRTRGGAPALDREEALPADPTTRTKKLAASLEQRVADASDPGAESERSGAERIENAWRAVLAA